MFKVSPIILNRSSHFCTYCLSQINCNHSQSKSTTPTPAAATQVNTLPWAAPSLLLVTIFSRICTQLPARVATEVVYRCNKAILSSPSPTPRKPTQVRQAQPAQSPSPASLLPLLLHIISPTTHNCFLITGRPVHLCPPLSPVFKSPSPPQVGPWRLHRKLWFSALYHNLNFQFYATF